MGGAFVGVSDDINAVNWNPAGLAQLSKPFFTSMINTEWDRFRCDAFLGVAYPAGNFGTVGIAYGGNWDPSFFSYNGTNVYTKISDQENDFFHFALGKYFIQDYLALGITGRWESKRFDWEELILDETSTVLSWNRGHQRTDRVDLDIGTLGSIGKKYPSPSLPIILLQSG